ncbi:MAG: OmpA family protein [Bacteroidales bacterium]|nr:OmpA family protein [Bacteroidales bacterium]
MKTFKKGLALLVVAILLAATAVAQNSVATLADQQFKNKQYIMALESYQKAYERVSSNKAEKNRIYFQIGECYRLMYNYPKAEHTYRRLIQAGYYSVEPKLYYYMAEMCRFDGKFDDADMYYDKYLELVPGDKLTLTRKKSLIDVTRWAADRSRHVITKLADWNTDYNDWSPRFMGNDTNTLVFTSSRYGTEEGGKDVWTGQNYSSFYTVYKDRNERWTNAPSAFDNSGKINTSNNEGEACFSPDGNTIYFTRCDIVEHESHDCAIYTATKAVAPDKKKKAAKKSAPAKKTDTKGKKGKDADKGGNDKKGKNSKNSTETASEEELAPGEWSTPVKINLGDSIYNYLYPAITSDGLTLYFCSDMPGGEGDYDIWKTTRASVADDFGKPVNMGPIINTPGREAFPILYGDSTMYFSSNGLPGIGGYDIFKTRIGKRVCSRPENLGVPINSSYDEMSIIYYPENEDNPMMERGYFSSNRPFEDPLNKNTDKKGKKLPLPTFNLFSFELPPLLYTIEGTVRDEKSMQLVKGAKVKLVGSDGSEAETYTDKKGFYRFNNSQVKGQVVYKMYFSKVDYFSLEQSESTKGYTVDKDIVHDCRMEPVPQQPVVLPEIRYDLSKWDLKEEFMDSLMDLYLVMVNNPSVVVEIRAHTDCRPFIGLTNDTLSQRRAQSVVDYLASRGIERDRLVAKGYAERVPRTLDRDVVIVVAGVPYTFSAGTTLECDFINDLPTKEHQEAAHQLNRRIEFLVLRSDYVSKRIVNNLASDSALVKQNEDGTYIDLVNAPVDTNFKDVAVIVHDEATIDVTMINTQKGEVQAIINGVQVPMLIDERYKEPLAISWEEAMNMLYQRRINKEDFPDRDHAFDPEGNILDKAKLVFKEIQIGQKHLYDVEMIVVKGIDYKFIINRAALGDFGEYEFDKQLGKLYFFDE